MHRNKQNRKLQKLQQCKSPLSVSYETTSCSQKKKGYPAAAVEFLLGAIAIAKVWFRSTYQNSSFTSSPPTCLSEDRTVTFLTWTHKAC